MSVEDFNEEEGVAEEATLEEELPPPTDPSQVPADEGDAGSADMEADA